MNNNKIRVLQVIGGMDMGGAETALMNIYRNINREKVCFDFLVFYTKEGHFDNEIRNLGGNIIKMKVPPKKGLLLSTGSFRKIIKENGPYDVVHSHIGFNSAYAIIAAFREEIPIRIGQAHTAGRIKKYRNFIFQTYHKYLTKVITKYSTSLIACSSAAGENIFGSWPLEKGKILKNAIDFNKYNSVSTRNFHSLRSKLKIDEDEIILASIARFSEVKNHIFMIDLSEKLKLLNIKHKLLFIGEGKLRQKLELITNEKGLGNYVKYLGLRSDVNELLRGIDIILMPSLYEGIPVSLIEAQACGVRCLVSDRVSKETDIGLNLLTFLSIDQGIENWVNEIKRYSRLTIDSTDIYSAIKNAGYDLNTILNQIMDLYLNKE